MRLELVAAMVACMLMASAIPEAFDDRGMLFAVAYITARAPLHAYAVVVFPREHYPRLAAVSIWISVAAALWPARWSTTARVSPSGAVRCSSTSARPMLRYRTPRFGDFQLRDAEVSTHHLIERFQLLVPGESIVLTGATAAGDEMTAARIGAIVVAVLVTATLWALYFGRDERRAQKLSAEAEGRQHLVRDDFTYLHLPIVAGLVVAAVANELVIAHPDEQLPGEELLALAAGPILFLLGSAVGGAACCERSRVARVAATGAVAGVALLGAALPALATWSLALVVLASAVLMEVPGP
jgi:low temperature requirement protein LtrA